MSTVLNDIDYIDIGKRTSIGNGPFRNPTINFHITAIYHDHCRSIITDPSKQLRIAIKMGFLLVECETAGMQFDSETLKLREYMTRQITKSNQRGAWPMFHIIDTIISRLRHENRLLLAYELNFLNKINKKLKNIYDTGGYV